eukprot:scaffold10013_cov79-Skeletonema_dohrnii-CCMP3373.AAC.4
MQDGVDTTVITDIPAACVGWKENKIQECIAEQALIGSILSQNNLDSVPAECADLNTDKLGECLSVRQTILVENGVTIIPSNCQGLQVDKLEGCIVDHNLVQTLLSQNNLESIPAECAGLNTDKLGECLSQRQTILLQNGVTIIPSTCQGLQVDKLEGCIVDHNLVQTLLSQNNLDSIPAECEGWNTDKLGECLSQWQTILDQNGVTSVPTMCQGLGVDELEDCLIDHTTVQTILNANNLDDIPADCAGVNADKLTECLHQWRLTQIILGVSNERIPPECVGMEKEKDLESCLEEFTLAPTNYPTYSPTLAPMTYAPTIWETYSPTATPVSWNAFAAHIGSEAASEEEEEVTFNLSETVALPIGRYAMSVTRYVNKKEKWNSDRHRTLRKDDGDHPRRHELDATRKHLREVYEAEFNIPVARIDVHFVNGGETAIGLQADGTIGKGIMRHSIFFGNALFVEGDANNATYLLPTEEQLEKATVNAFTGEQKQAFIEKYHYEATGRSYFGIKYSYDVNVRKNLQPDIVPPTVILPTEVPQGLEEGASSPIADQEGMGWVAQVQEWSSSVESSLGTSTTFIVLILLAGVLLGTLVGLTALVIRRKRRNRAEKPNSRVIMGDFIDDEPDALGSVIGSEIENGGDMLYSQRVRPSNRIQSSLPIMTDDFEDCVSQLAASDEDSAYKGMEKETKEVDSGESTKGIDSGDSVSTMSFSLRSAVSGNSGKESDEDEVDVEHQLS